MLTSLCLALLAAAPELVAVVDFNAAPGVATVEERQVLGDQVRRAATRALPRERFSVLTRGNMEVLVPPEEMARCTCEDVCLVEIGRIVQARYVVGGDVRRFQKQLRLTVEMYDVTTGGVVASEEAAGKDLVALEEGLRKVAPALFVALVPPSAPAANNAVAERAAPVGTAAHAEKAPGKAAEKVPQKPADDVRLRVSLEGVDCQGPATARVTIVEYTDFQCPFCARVTTTLRDLRAEMPDDLRWCFKHLPLPFHKDAPAAAVASLAASRQGRFWPMRDALFATQKDLSADALEVQARAVGLDMARYRKDVQDPALAARVRVDASEADRLGIRGTPTFVINGRRMSGAQPPEKFRAVIAAARADADAELARGTRRADVFGALNARGVDRADPPGNGPAPVATRRDVPVRPDETCRGPASARVTIVEYGDFQCPFCARVLPTLEKLRKAYPRDVRTCFRHQPLAFHKDARLAAEAAVEARVQGRFWELHDRLFANQAALDRASLLEHARAVGMDTRSLAAALEDGRHEAAVEQDIKSANALGARGTPAFFVNGWEHPGAQPYERFEERVKAELESTRAR